MNPELWLAAGLADIALIVAAAIWFPTLWVLVPLLLVMAVLIGISLMAQL